MTNKTGVTALNNNDSTAKVTVNNIADTTATYGLKGSTVNNLELNYKTGALNGTSDKLNVKLNGATNATVDAESGFESVEVNTTAASTLTSIVAPNATALTLSGNATLELAANAIDTFSDYTVTNTGKVTYNNGISSVKTFVATSNTDGIVGKVLVTTDTLDKGTTSNVLKLASTGSLVQTGTGADNINVDTSALFSSNSAVVKLGAGNDTLALTAGNSSEYVYGEAGDDFIYVAGGTTSTDLVDGGEGNDTLAFASGTTNALIAKSIENVKVASAASATTAVNFTSVDSAIAIADSGAGATTFSNLKNGSTYTSTVAKAAAADDVTLNFATGQAATINVDLQKGTKGDVTLTNVADATVTLGAASTMGTGISLDKTATKLTVNATDDASIASILAGTSVDSTTEEKLATIAVTGNKAVTVAAIANDKSL